jgi:hypothetical protein
VKYIFNGVLIDSEIGSPSLGIPAGDVIPAQPGDTVQVDELKVTVPLPGLYAIREGSVIRIGGFEQNQKVATT